MALGSRGGVAKRTAETRGTEDEGVGLRRRTAIRLIQYCTTVIC